VPQEPAIRAAVPQEATTAEEEAVAVTIREEIRAAVAAITAETLTVEEAAAITAVTHTVEVITAMTEVTTLDPPTGVEIRTPAVVVGVIILKSIPISLVIRAVMNTPRR
jgi:hypothetical protein